MPYNNIPFWWSYALIDMMIIGGSSVIEWTQYKNSLPLNATWCLSIRYRCRCLQEHLESWHCLALVSWCWFLNRQFGSRYAVSVKAKSQMISLFHQMIQIVKAFFIQSAKQTLRWIYMNSLSVMDEGSGNLALRAQFWFFLISEQRSEKWGLRIDEYQLKPKTINYKQNDRQQHI